MMEITTSWHEKGREIGLIEGKEQGERKVLHRQITKKFGPLSPELSQQIEELEIDELDDLAEELLDFQSLSDLIRWLENRKAVER